MRREKLYPYIQKTQSNICQIGVLQVDEAVALLQQYDMNSSIGSAHHLSIADAQGKSVVVEYVNGEMLVTETKVVTNHYLSDCEKQGIGSEQSSTARRNTAQTSILPRTMHTAMS